MKLRNNQSGNVALIVLALVIGLVIGIAGGRAMKNDNHNMHSMSSSSSDSSKASDLRANLVTLGMEHMQLTNKAVDDALGAAPGADASAKALYDNGNDIGAAVGSVYGKDAESTFNTVWKLHLDQFVAYAVASSKGDDAGKQTALDTINSQYTKPLAQYLAKANPNLPEKTLETALDDHVQMTAQMIDDHVQGKYTEEQAELKMADKHIEGLFSTLAAAIVKQYPDKF